MLLYVIRHGEPDYADDSLTPAGKLQAEALGKKLGKVSWSHIYSSPLGRARKTAEPLAWRAGLQIEQETWTSEALVWNEFRRDSSGLEEPNLWASNIANYKFHTPENRRKGDDWQSCDCLQNLGSHFTPETGCARLKKQSDEFLKKLGYERFGGQYRIQQAHEENIALFCHSGFCSCWFPYLLDIPHHLFWSCFSPLSHTGVVMVYFQNFSAGWTCPRILCWNDLSHLYADGLKQPYLQTPGRVH